MITRENTQATRGDGQTFVKPELGTEVRDRIFLQLRGIFCAPGFLVVDVTIEPANDLTNAHGEFRILQSGTKLGLGNFVKDRDGVMVEILPAARGKFVEKFLSFLIPGPPDVPG